MDTEFWNTLLSLIAVSLIGLAYWLSSNKRNSAYWGVIYYLALGQVLGFITLIERKRLEIDLDYTIILLLILSIVNFIVLYDFSKKPPPKED